MYVGEIEELRTRFVRLNPWCGRCDEPAVDIRPRDPAVGYVWHNLIPLCKACSRRPEAGGEGGGR